MRNYILKCITIFCLVLALGKSYGQVMNDGIIWQRTIGGNSMDYASSAKQTSDGGYIIAATSTSLISGDKSENSVGAEDYWIIKLDFLGNTQWQKNIGGSNYDRLSIIQNTNDGGYIIGGSSNSNISGQKTVDTHNNSWDYWIVKLDRNGNIQWQKSIGGTSLDMLTCLQVTSDGGYILGGYSISNISGDKSEKCRDTLQGTGDYWIVKLNSTGNIQWQKTIGGSNTDYLYDIQLTSDGGYILGGISASNISGEKTENSRGNSDNWIIKINATGGIQWQKTYGGSQEENNTKILPTLDSGYIVGSTSKSNVSGDKTDGLSGLGVGSDYWILKLDRNGVMQWQKSIGGSFEEYFRTMQITLDGNYLIGGYSSSDISGEKTEPRLGSSSPDFAMDYWVLKIDTLGNVIWQKAFGGAVTDDLWDIQITTDGSYLLIGYSTSNISGNKTQDSRGGEDCFILLVNSKYITGNVFSDINNNCIKDGSENGVAKYVLKATKGLYNSYSATQINGKYYLAVSDTGLYNIELFSNPTYPYFTQSNCNSYSIHIRDTIVTANLPLKPQFLCALNTVNISTYAPPFRSGRPYIYYIGYCNNGTITSPNTYITIKLDSLLDFNSASIPYTTLPNHTYRFNIGNLDLTCGDFSFVATPNRNSTILGQTLCTEAHIYPDTICTTPNYTGSYIVASARCLGDSVELKLENRGGNMQQIKKYIVIEDQVMRINRNYQLPRNGTIIEKMPADSGHTYRIIAEQEDALPPSYGDKFATAAIEGCRPNPALNFSTGYFTQFPNYDGEPFRAVSCNVITGSYDPNDKVASPVGYAAQHYIEKNTQIDYQINFQNTGNDTAFKVVVVDTIAQTLDINSIQLGVASHAYQFQRTDSNVVQFVFDNILLVDSFRNEPKSHGFVKFKIQQKLNNPNGTKIYNSAGIYFDYNAPIITNRTFHTVGQNFVTVQLINTIKNPKYNVKEVKVFPNPFRDKTQIIVESNELKNPVLLLMNIQGQLIKTISSTNNTTFDIYRDDLSNGMYLFKIMQSDETVANGKVVVQ